MVGTISDDENGCRFVLRPNRSMSWREVQIFYFAIASVLLIPGMSFCWLGLWPVLPFAGAEMLALGAALYVTALDSHRHEVVCIRDDLIRIEKGRDRPAASWRMNRDCARAHLLKPSSPRHPSRLVLRWHNHEVELGCFLSEAERRALYARLECAIGRRAA